MRPANLPGAISPAAGLWLMTRPAAMVTLEAVVTAPTVRPETADGCRRHSLGLIDEIRHSDRQRRSERLVRGRADVALGILRASRDSSRYRRPAGSHPCKMRPQSARSCSTGRA